MSSQSPSLTEKLSNIQHMPSLLAATVASDKPTDVYLIRDIIKMSYESPQTRVFLQKYLTNLLSTSKNVYVKTKVLLIVVSLLDEGHPDFHRNLQKTPESFKEASVVKPTNPDLAGDCGRIRDLANKVLDKLFEDPPTERACPYGVRTNNVSESPRGYEQRSPYSGGKTNALLGGSGASYAGGSGVRSEGLSGRIQGFGTTSSSSGSESTLQSISSQFTSAMGSIFGSTKQQRNLQYDQSYASMSYVPQSSSSIMGMTGGGASSYGYQQTSKWSKDDQEEERASTGQTENRFMESRIEQEKRLVDDITAPGGVRVAPTREMMSSFISRCKSLDCLVIVEFLKEKLNSDSHQTVLKTLFVIEGLIRSDIPDVLSYLDLVLDELNHLSSSSQASIKAKATKLLSQLSVVNSMSTVESTKSDDNQSLLILGGVNTNEEPILDKQSNDTSGIFAGLTLTSSSPKVASSPPKVVHKTISPPVAQYKPELPTNQLIEDLPVVSSSPITTKATHTVFVSNDNTGGGGGKDLLDFGAEKDNEDFDPLTGGGVTSSSELLTGLTSLDEPAGPAQLNTTPLIPITSQEPLLQMNPPMAQPMSQLMSQPMSQPMNQPLGQLMNQPMSQPMGQQGFTYPYIAQQGTDSTNYYSVVSNRPVQRFPTKTDASNSTGFDFLTKNTKSSPFDFVKDEMKASMGK